MTPPKKKTKKRKKKTRAQKDREARAAWLEPLRHTEAIIGIDCGAESGIAVLDIVHRRWRYRQTKGDNLGRATAEADIGCCREGLLAVTVIIETPPNYGFKNVIAKLAEYRGRAKEAAEVADFHVIEVTPTTWQTALFGKGKRDTKTESLRLAREITGVVTIADHNIADAICIAEWARREREKMQ